VYRVTVEMLWSLVNYTWIETRKRKGFLLMGTVFLVYQVQKASIFVSILIACLGVWREILV
jgi:hypothetical protein